MKTGKPENQDEVPNQITCREAGRRGGSMTRERHGLDFYRKIGALGGETTKKRWGHLFAQFGKRGGRPRRPTLDEFVGE